MTLLLVMCVVLLRLETGPVTGAITAVTVWAAPDPGRVGSRGRWADYAVGGGDLWEGKGISFLETQKIYIFNFDFYIFKRIIGQFD